MTETDSGEQQAVWIEAADDFFTKSGPLPAAFDDVRRFPRFYYRSYAAATVFPLPGMPEAAPLQCQVLTRDLSRGGLGVLTSDQLFPGQRLDVALQGDALRSWEVMWCRRVADRSYACGCKLFAPAISPTDASAMSGAAYQTNCPPTMA